MVLRQVGASFLRHGGVFLRSVMVAALALWGLAATADEPDLSEMLNRPAYLKAWQAMLANEPKLDDWLAQYAVTRNGPVRPGRTLVLDQRTYQANDVCKTHDCGDNRLVVLFAPEGQRAWGLWCRAGKPLRYLGQPDGNLKQALEQAMKTD